MNTIQLLDEMTEEAGMGMQVASLLMRDQFNLTDLETTINALSAFHRVVEERADEIDFPDLWKSMGIMASELFRLGGME